MKPYYEDDAVTIYHANCREWFSSLPECFSVDAVVTDPPWNLGFFQDDDQDWPAYKSMIGSVVSASRRIAPGQCWFFSTKCIPHVSTLFSDSRPFAAVKNFSQMHPKRLPNCWDIAFIDEHKYLGNGRNWFLCDTAGMLKERTAHPTPRTLELMSYVLGMFDWQSIVDPFMGSGTTLRAAKDLGRKAIGIEIEERYCEIAARRMAQEVLPL